METHHLYIFTHRTLTRSRNVFDNGFIKPSDIKVITYFGCHKTKDNETHDWAESESCVFNIKFCNCESCLVGVDMLLSEGKIKLTAKGHVRFTGEAAKHRYSVMSKHYERLKVK